MNKVKAIIASVQNRVKGVTSSITLPGFDGESVYDVFSFLFKDWLFKIQLAASTSLLRFSEYKKGKAHK